MPPILELGISSPNNRNILHALLNSINCHFSKTIAIKIRNKKLVRCSSQNSDLLLQASSIRNKTINMSGEGSVRPKLGSW